MPPAAQLGRKTIWLFTVLALAATAGVTSAATAAGEPVAAMTAPLYQRVNATTKANLVTPWGRRGERGSAEVRLHHRSGDPVQGIDVGRHRAHVGPPAVPLQQCGLHVALEGSAQLANAVKAGYGPRHELLRGGDPAAGRHRAGQLLRVGHGAPAVARVHRIRPGQPGLDVRGCRILRAHGRTVTPPPIVPNPPSAAGSPGAPTVGTASSTPPSGAVYDSPAGNDAAAGSAAAPVRTIARGVALAPAGGTVVCAAAATTRR